ncbi:MAG: penicillin acylase family protein [Thermoleophilaceae bacterium]
MRRLAVTTIACLAALTASASAAPPQPGGYQQDDGRGFHNILPPGTNGLDNLAQLAAFEANGARPPHNEDQLGMYGDLVYAAPGLKPEDLSKYYKDASFGVQSNDIARTYSPRPDVTIVRDSSFGVPHIYGANRAGLMFGAGYAAAEDRLFFIDVLRHLGRAQLSSFVGGAQGNRDFDKSEWQTAPYNEADLQRQIDQLPVLYGGPGKEVQDDISNFVDGVNKYISEARLDPTKMPGEYAAIGKPQGPDDWKGTDIIATAALVGGIFGNGGGGELEQAQLLQAMQKRFGNAQGRKAWDDFRSAEDPEAPATVHGKSFPYEAEPKTPANGSLAMPDPGSVEPAQIAQGGGASGAANLGGARSNVPKCTPTGLICLPKANSNALIVSGGLSQSGHPLAVFGPQTGYFAPQILMEEDLHAPAADGGQAIDARGAAFPGVNLYVELGRGRDYAWSATSAGQDITDTFAVDLCEPDGRTPTLASDSYTFRGQCLPMETLERDNSWVPNGADSTPPGSEKLIAQRTKLGLVIARATIDGKPVAYTSLRTTYMHEVDSALGFVGFNDPNAMTNPHDFQVAASKIGYTFNWLYVDDKHDAYYNSGANPVKAPGVDPNFPVTGSPQFEWRGFNPDDLTEQLTPFEQHPQTVDQPYLTSWNNKEAKGYRAPDGNFGYSSVYRSQPLDDGINSRTKNGRKMSLTDLIDAMESAGTVDLPAYKDLPLALKVLGNQSDPELANAIAKLKAWYHAGAHRIDRDHNGHYDHSDAIKLMDAWWPLWVGGEFQPTLGSDLYKQTQQILELSNDPNNHGDHLGSAYQDGWYGYVSKDLRTLLKSSSRRTASRHPHRRTRAAGATAAAKRRHAKRNRKGHHRTAKPLVPGQYSRIYCGQGSLKGCREMLARTLKQAIDADPAQLYKDDVCSSNEGKGWDPQMCFDAVRQRPLGAVTEPLIHWINRPTFQQADEIQSHR